MNESIDQNDELGNLGIVGLQPDNICLRTTGDDSMTTILFLIYDVLLDVLTLGALDKLSHAIRLIEELDILLDRRSLPLVDLLHGGAQQALDEPGHVVDGAIDEEFLDIVLVRKSLNEPQA